MLSCAGLHFYYGSSLRLSEVGFSASAGSMVGIFGHNGSGKSTLLKMLGACLPIKSGTVFFKGKQALGNDGYICADLRAQFGVLFQGTSSDEKLSCYDNLAYSAQLMGISKASIHKLVVSTLDFATLSDRAHESVKKLSVGMRRRLELYRTFLHRPCVVLLDEPTASLDMLESEKFFSFLRNYQKSTSALVLMSSHRADELLGCNRVLFMSEGKILKEGSPIDMVSCLNYVRCTFTLPTHRELLGSDLPLFDIQKEHDVIRAKILTEKLPALLANPLLSEGRFKAFSVEKPSLADVYHDLCEKRGLE